MRKNLFLPIRLLFWISLLVPSVIIASKVIDSDLPAANRLQTQKTPSKKTVANAVSKRTSPLNDTPKEAALACALSIAKVDVSGCYSVSGANWATVNVEVAWSEAPANGYIVVSTGAQSKTITPGTITVTYPQVPGNPSATGNQVIVSPQVVAFEVTANSSVGTITAAFSNLPSCSATRSFTAPAPCPPTSCTTTDLGGVVFKDFNDNGIKESGETVGVGSVAVKAIACDGTTYTDITDFYGRYTIPVPANKYPVRVEFSAIPLVYNLSVNGTGSRTTTQFVAAANCAVNLGVYNPIDYCNDSPRVFVPCYVNGNPLTSGNTGTSDALVSIPYGVSSLSFVGEQAIATASQVGSLWGLAYNKSTKKLFASAVLKRHAGLGPLGLGGIYVVNYTNPASPVTSNFLSVTSLGVNVGTIASNALRDMNGTRTDANRDEQAFAQIGKIGIGDIELSEDGNLLWFTNLFDKKLYSVDITNYNLNGSTLPTNGDVTSYTIPATCSSATGAYRPWALKVYNGKVYVGGVCDAQISGNKSDLRASVYELNGNTFTQIFDFPLTYPKGYPAAANRNITGWFPWTDTFNDLLDGSTTLRHPVPIFTDIEFDVDGSMVLAFGDRTGMQGGDLNYRPDDSNNSLYEVNSQAGDILRAYYSNNTFVLENNAKAGPNSGYGPNNRQGPGFGEFYNDNWIQENGTVLYHAENVMGGLALKPGSGEVVMTAVDPVDRQPFAGGVRYMDNETGISTGQYSVYVTRLTNSGPQTPTNPGTFGKASGLGDIELSCNTIDLMQIGNRLWLDDDRDGEQDACEKGLPNVAVSLYRSGTLVATTRSNANGEYYFPNYANPSSVTFTGSTTALSPNTAYQLVFGTSGQYNNGTSVLTVDNGKYLLTTANASGGNKNDLNDSDAALATVAGTTAPVISLTTDAIGMADHTFDVGFYCQTITTGAISTTAATCNLATNLGNSNARISVSGIVNADKAALVVVGNTPPSYTAASNVSIISGVATFTGISNPTATSGTSYSIIIFNGPCCSTAVTTLLPRTDCSCDLSLSVTPGDCNPVNNQYAVTGTISLTNTPASNLTVVDGVRSTVVSVTAGQASVNFSLTGLNSNGTNHTVTVTSSGTSCGSLSTTYAAPASCTVPATIIVTSATVCYGNSTTLISSGCSGTVTWSNGTTGANLVTPVLTNSTNYTATCTTASQTTFAVGTVTVLPRPVVSLQASNTFVTAGTPVSLSAIGCVGTLVWNNGQTTTVMSVTPVNASQTYSATCTTGPNCLTTASITINTLPPAGLIVSSATICYGNSTTLISSGCSGTVTWSNGTTGANLITPTLTATTNYTATCTTSTGSVTTAVGTVTVLPRPVVTLQASGTFVTAGSTVSLSAIGCVGTLVWNNGQTTAVMSVTPVNASQTYSATCTTGPNCLTTASITINTLPPASVTASSTTICYGSSATLVASGCSSGTIGWSNGTTGSTLTIGSLTATTSYTATCSTPTGSVATAVGTVTVNPRPVLTIQASNTFVTAGTPVSLSAIGCVGTLTWSTGQSASVISVTPVNASQTYSATCTTGPNCLTTASITINTLPPAGLIVSSATICYGNSTTLISSGCSGTVTWSNGTTGANLVTPTLTATTNYTATCTTSTGSVTTAVGTVTVLPRPVVTLQASGTFVTAGSTVSLSAIGCVGTLVWNNGQTTAVMSVTPVNASQTYSATCTTGPNCLTTASITINTLPPASLTASSTTICYGSSATLVATGCSSGTIAWSNGTTGSTLTIGSLTATTSYTATCSTPTGSVATAVGTVTVNPRPVLTIQASNTFVTAGTPVSLSAIGCVGTLTWSTGQSASVISVTPMNASQTYSATCTTGPNCLTTASITINTLPPAGLIVSSASICAGSSTTLTAAGCTGTVTWSNGTTGTTLATPNLTTTTSYTATCTTPTGSVTTAVGTVFVEQPASLTISRTSAAASETITVSVRGCTGSLAWSTGSVDNGKTSIVVSATQTSAYSVTCTSPLGCVSSASLNVGSLDPNDFTVGDAIVCEGQSTTLTAIGCLGTINWLGTGVNGQTTASVVVNPAQTTTYTVVCTNGGTVTELAALVNVVPAPSITLTASSLTVTEGQPLSFTALGCTIGQLAWSMSGVTGNVLSTTATLTTSVYSVTCSLTPTCLDIQRLTITVIPLLPQLNLVKVASKSRANLGDVISYTVTLTNSGNAPATNVVVEDIFSAGLAYVPGSASVSSGTFAAGSPVNSWSISSLAAGANATLVLSASVLAEGVHYNTARVPGDTTTVCTSVAYRVCRGTDYAIRILGPAGYSRYQWYNGSTLLTETTTNSFTATAAGEYHVVVDNGAGTCPDGTCCPVIIEEVSVPATFTLLATNPTCVGLDPQANGIIQVSGLGSDLTGYTYAISQGSSFTTVNPTALPIPSTGILSSTLTGTKTYTVRVFNQLGCFADRVITLTADCVCPPPVCLPISIKKIVRQ